LRGCAAPAVLFEADGDAHGIGNPPLAGLGELACADGCDAGTGIVGRGLVCARLAADWAAAGLDVPEEPGWPGEVSLEVGAGLADVDVAGLLDVGAGLVLVTGGDELPDGPGFGLLLPGGELLTSWHFFAAGELAPWRGVYAGVPEPDGYCAAPLEACCRPGPPPPLPDGWCCLVDELLDEIACGMVIAAAAPAATTKISVAIAAAGRSQARRGRALPGPGADGQNLPAALRNPSAIAVSSDPVRPAIRSVVSEYQPAAVANDSSGGRPSRALIRSSPSEDGSTDSAAACSALRSTSS